MLVNLCIAKLLGLMLICRKYFIRIMNELLEAINYFKAKKADLHNSKSSNQILGYEMRLDMMLGILEEAGIDRANCEIEEVQRGSHLMPKISFSIGEYPFILMMVEGGGLQLRHNNHHIIMRNPLQEFSAVSLKQHLVNMAVN